MQHDNSMEKLNFYSEEMQKVYNQVRDGTIELKPAELLANIAGKGLKAEQLKLAREIFLKDAGGQTQPVPLGTGSAYIGGVAFADKPPQSEEVEAAH